MKSCIIVGAGELPEKAAANLQQRAAWCYIIAADGGLRHLECLNIVPDAIIGDFDSVDEGTVFQRNARGDAPYEVVELPREKDVSDMAAAIDHGLERGCEEFHIYGGAGGRLDHTLANVQLLAGLVRQNKRGFLYGEHEIVTAIQREPISFAAESAGVFSVFSHGGKASGVIIHGAKYLLDNATLSNDTPLGLSNEFIGEPIQVSAESGTLMIVFKYDAMLL